jgi:cellulose synthase operon protein C
MSGFWLTPAAPGTVPTAHLDGVRTLHTAVRDWLERAAVAQRNDHIRANLPYVDLMFAFGFATLGDHPTANKLVEDARTVLEGPIPEGGNPLAEQAVTAAVVRNFMFKAFRSRVEQALRGEPPGGQLSAEVLVAREQITATGGTGPINNPYKLAAYVIDRFREQSRIVDLQEKPDPYADWTKHGDPMKRELAELHTIHDPAVLAERMRRLHRDGVPGKQLAEVQFYVLHEGLPLAGRVSEAFVVELLAHVPAALATTGSPDLPKKQGELLERALFIAGHFGRSDIVTKLVDEFTALVHSKPEDVRYKLINVVARQCIRNLKRLGLTEDVDRLLTNLHAEVLRGASTADLRKKYASKPEAWSAVLQTLLNLAGGWMFLGLHDRAAPILAEARNELLNTNALALQPKDYAELARAYVAALGQGPCEQGLAAMIELFRRMDPLKITNTWTTAQYYSRFHLNLVEDTVLALYPPCPDDPVPAIVQA